MYERIVMGEIDYYRQNDGPVQGDLLSNSLVYAQKTREVGNQVLNACKFSIKGHFPVLTFILERTLR